MVDETRANARFARFPDSRRADPSDPLGLDFDLGWGEMVLQ